MILYASQTHGRRNLDALKANGFHILSTPDTWRGKPPRWTTGELAPFALDNGAWGCFRRGEPFNWLKFQEMADQIGHLAKWIIAPDIVAGGVASLEMSIRWRHGWNKCPTLLAVQDGMTPADLLPHLNQLTGIAIGGTTEFKLKTLPRWSKLASDVGCYLHVLRVNSRRRLVACDLGGADSIDGTSATVFSVNAPKLRRWVEEIHKQPTLGLWK